MHPLPGVVGPNVLTNTFLGDVQQLCIVTADLQSTMDGMLRLGIGPWHVRTFDASNLRDTTYRGEPVSFTMRIAIGHSRNMQWELIQPLSGPSMYSDFLTRHGEGLQHVAFSWDDAAEYDETIAQYAAHGFERVQSGYCFDVCRFDYFATEDAIGTVFETFYAPKGFVFPPPDSWYPAPPPG